DLESDRRRGQWLDPDDAKTIVTAWAGRWVETLDVETRTEENYRASLRNHILPRWGTTSLGEITALAVTAWIKPLRQHHAASTSAAAPSPIDPNIGALHESKHRLWLGPPKTPASARNITLPRFLASLLQMHLSASAGDFVFTSPLGHPLRRSDFDRRVFRPAV